MAVTAASRILVSCSSADAISDANVGTSSCCSSVAEPLDAALLDSALALLGRVISCRAGIGSSIAISVAIVVDAVVVVAVVAAATAVFFAGFLEPLELSFAIRNNR